MNLCGGFDDAAAMKALAHRDPNVRRWAVRLVGDARQASPAIAGRLAELAETEPDVDVRSQLASSARRFPAAAGLPIVRGLLARSEDADDLHIPLLLWWAIEAKAESDRAAVLALFQEPSVWSLPIVERSIIERLMERYAMAGGSENLETCARLLAMSPGPHATTRLMVGMLEAFRGREITGLPPKLAEALDRYQQGLGKSDLALGLRRGDPDAVAQALKVVADEKADRPTRLAYIEILGQIHQPKAVATLTKLLSSSSSHAIKRVALEALMNYDDPAIGKVVLRQYQSTLPDEHGVRSTAQRLLASRKAWTLALLDDIEASSIEQTSIPLTVVQQIRLQNDPEITRRVEKLWGRVRPSPAEAQQQIERYQSLLRSGRGDLASGKAVFTQNCATCHKLFGEGGSAGPELTGYERTNLEFMLPAIVDPSAAIREEFTNFAVFTNGRPYPHRLDPGPEQPDRDAAERGQPDDARQPRSDRDPPGAPGLAHARRTARQAHRPAGPRPVHLPDESSAGPEVIEGLPCLRRISEATRPWPTERSSPESSWSPATLARRAPGLSRP